MLSVPSLVWSSRENIREQLLSILQTVPLECVALRCRVVRLLGIFGGAQHSSSLLAVVLDDREHVDTRVQALRAVVKHGAPLPGPELRRVVEQLPKLDYCPCCCPPLEEVLTLARTENTWEAAEALLQQASTWERANVLASARRTPLSPRLVEWLYSRWFQHDRYELAEDESWGRGANLRVAVAHRERPEAWALLMDWVRDSVGEELDPAVFRKLPLEEQARIFGVAHQKPAARVLLQPLPDLLDCFGQDALLRRLRYIVRDESVAQKVTYRFKESPHGLSRAMDLLVEWREARPVLCSLLCDFDITDGVRRALLDRLFDHDRAMTVRWALIAVRYPDNAPLVRFVLQCAAQKPEPADRPLFLAALRGEDDEARALALEGLFSLGESGAGWCDRLTSLVHASHERVRLRAAACLAREGRREWLPLLRQTSLEDPESEGLREEAVRWLGLVDPEASRPVLKQVLAKAPMEVPGSCHPGADEAAWALSRLGTTEDLSALLDAALRGCCSKRIDRELEYHLARQEGRPSEDVPPPWSEWDRRRHLAL